MCQLFDGRYRSPRSHSSMYQLFDGTYHSPRPHSSMCQLFDCRYCSPRPHSSMYQLFDGTYCSPRPHSIMCQLFDCTYRSPRPHCVFNDYACKNASRPRASERGASMSSYALVVFSTITQMARAGVSWAREAVYSYSSYIFTLWLTMRCGSRKRFIILIGHITRKL